jgi:hypothetical protein
MSENVSPGNIAGFAAFASTLSVGTAPRSGFGARLTTLFNVSELAALKTSHLSSKAARIVSYTSQLETPDGVFVLGAALLTGAKLWADAAKSFWRNGLAPIGAGGTSAIGRGIIPIWRAASGAQSFATVIERGTDVGAIGSAAPAATTEIVPLTAGVASLMWTNWAAVVLGLCKMVAAVSHEALTIIGRVASVVSGAPQVRSIEGLGEASARARYSGANANQYGLISSVLASVAASESLMSPRALANLNQPEFRNSSQQGLLTFGRAAAIAMLSAPLFVGPKASMLQDPQRIDKACSASIVINSTPTIVINSSQAAEIEHQVLEALAHHREAIFEQWSRELQRRQRTEF